MKKYMLWFGLALELLALLFAWFECTDTVSFFQDAARWTGRVSLFFYTIMLLFFLENPKLPGIESVRQTKRAFVRNFAVLHLIHLSILLTFVQMSGTVLIPLRVAGGALAYILTVLAPFVFNRKRYDVPRWMPFFQGFYLFWLWFVFMMTYVGRLQGQMPNASGNTVTYWVLFVYVWGLGIVAAWRMWQYQRLERARRQI